MTTAAARLVPDQEDRNFFDAGLLEVDPEIGTAISCETVRQRSTIELIASENIVSRAVLEATGSVFTNKYAEGYPGKRYYGGCEWADVVETLAIERARQLFGCAFANVQPNSGSQMNQAVFLALLQPGDTFMGLDLAAGGHLTHGSPVNMSGKWFNCVSYGVRREDQLLDMEDIAAKARAHKPRLIIAGATAYPRVWDFAAFRAIADEVGAHLLVDMSHFAGLVAGGAHPSPFPHAHVVTTTTHKSMRGPRSGIILTNDEALAKKLNAAVFPGLQGGPLMHVIAAKAVAFAEALRPDFKSYARAIVDNARTLASTLVDHGFDLVSGGTDNHLLLVDLRSKEVTGQQAEAALDRAGITCNKNSIPFDPQPPSITSGIRMGTPAGTTRGFGPAEFHQIGGMIATVVDGLRRTDGNGDRPAEAMVRSQVEQLCARFPIYPMSLMLMLRKSRLTGHIKSLTTGPNGSTMLNSLDFRAHFHELVSALAGETGLVRRRRRNRPGIAQAPRPQGHEERWRVAPWGSPTEQGSESPRPKSLRPTDSGGVADGFVPSLHLSVESL